MGPRPPAQGVGTCLEPPLPSLLWGELAAATKQLTAQTSKAVVCALVPSSLLSQSKSDSAFLPPIYHAWHTVSKHSASAVE